MSKIYKPGERAPRSGRYEIVGPRGGKTGDECTVTRGHPLPPTPKHGESYKLVRSVHEGRGKVRTQESIAATHARFGGALKNLAKR
jgi:hypothetical protein